MRNIDHARLDQIENNARYHYDMWGISRKELDELLLLARIAIDAEHAARNLLQAVEGLK